MIIKLILGAGARGLLNYIAQISKAPAHHPHTDHRDLRHVHVTNVDWHPSRGSQRPTRINELQKLSSLNLVHIARYRPTGQSAGQVLLQPNACSDLGRGSVANAIGVRRPGHRVGSDAARTREQLIEIRHARPEFSTFAGSTPREISAEFAALRKLRPGLKKAVGHLILAPGPCDRLLSKEEWKKSINITLAAHGAKGAAYAAYLHHDTENQHCHLFFSRIHPNGSVISDSQSYLKNRLATKQITRELQLMPLSDTQNPAAPGDRKALGNATNRAGRQGFAPITAAEYRAAVMTATAYNHLLQLLNESNIEFKPVLRGKAEIYGSLVRRKGTNEWIKTSTLAKDLSWPKISHRFLDAQASELVIPPADQTKEPLTVFDQQKLPAEVLLAQGKAYKNSLDLSKAPALLQKILTAAPAAQQEPLGAQFDERLQVVSGRIVEMLPISESPLVQTGFLVSMILVEAARFSAQAIAALLRFLRHMLSFFSIGLRSKTVPQIEREAVAVTEALQYEPYFLTAENQLLGMDKVDDKVSCLLKETLQALQTGKLDGLPKGVEGRDALIATLKGKTEDSGTTGTTGATVAADRQAPSAEPVTSSRSNIAQTNVDQMIQALGDFISASEDRQDEFEQSVFPLRAAEEKYAAAVTSLKTAKEAHAHYVKSKPKFLQRLVPNLDTTSELNAINLAKGELSLAEVRHSGKMSEEGAMAVATSRALLLNLAGPAHDEMLDELNKIASQFAEGPRAKEGSFAAVLELFVQHRTPGLASEMWLFVRGFDAELRKAQGLQQAATEALREKEAFERAQCESQQRGQTLTLGDDTETHKL